MTTNRCRFAARFLSWLGSVALVLLSGASSVALAQSSGNSCLKEASGINNPACTANDVRIGSYRLVAGPSTCAPGQQITVTLEAIVESGPARYAIGLWINEAGGDAKLDTGDNCYRDFLHPVDSSAGANQCNNAVSGGPYFDADNDGCGDVYASGTNPCGNAETGACSDGGGGTCMFTRTTFTVDLICTDTDGDGTADVSSCTSWDNQVRTAANACNDELDTNPGTGSKCNCGQIPILGLTPVCDAAAQAACAAQNTVCAQFACDPQGAPNNCDTVTFSPATTECRGSAGVCDVAETCTGDSAACPADGFVAASTECRASGGVCDVAESCTGSSAACPADAFVAASTECRASGGVCDVAESCTGSSAACPADAFVAASTECRASGGVCDVAESCTGSSAACPADAFVAASTECRASGGVCDVAESCTGSSAACPADAFVAASTECRASGGVCDVAESCTGSSAACPADAFVAASTECRASGGVCDVAESCTGSSAACPADAFVAASTECRASGGVCDVAESCTGSSAACPADAFVAASTECRASGGVCDVAESCTGSSAACPADAFVAASTECRASGGVCDVAESCTGSSAACPADAFVAASTECRASGGVCDVAESCTGSSAACPADAFVAASTECRPVSSECDIAESCTGSSAECPVDVNPPCADEICRTAGFWSTHGGTEKKALVNFTQDVLDEAGGILVCGQQITNTSLNSQASALEAMCVSPQGNSVLQLARQLTAAALNCFITSGVDDCSQSSIATTFATCNAACPVGDAAVVANCIDALDCYNNGGAFDDATGTCKIGDCVAAGIDVGDCGLDHACPAGSACVPTPGNCHDADLCNESLGLCFEGGPAGSTNACNRALHNPCTILGNCN